MAEVKVHNKSEAPLGFAGVTAPAHRSVMVDEKAWDVFKLSTPGKAWVPHLLEEVAEDEDDDGDNERDAIKAQLDEMGVEYNARLGTEKLQAALDAALELATSPEGAEG